MNFYFNKKLVALILLLTTLVVVFFVIALSTNTEKAKQNFFPSPSPLQYSNTLNKKDDAIRQDQVDYDLSRQQSLFQKRYPWYNKIPPKNDSFFIMFDATNNTFYTELYPLTKSGVSLPEQVTELKRRVVATLEGIDVNTSLYKFEWLVFPSDSSLYPDGHY